MGKRYVTVKVRVSPETFYHLKQYSNFEKCSLGRVIDKLCIFHRTNNKLPKIESRKFR